MKKLFVIAASAIIALSISAFAQDQKSGKDEKCCKTEVVCNADKKCNEKDCKPGNCDKFKACQDAKKCCKAGKGQKHCGKKGEGHHGKKFGKGKRAFEGIDLTEEQKSKVEALKEDVRKDMRVAKADIKAKKGVAKAKFDEGMKNILTKDQYEQYTQNLQKKPRLGDSPCQKDKMCKGRGNHKGGKHGRFDGKRLEQKGDSALSGFKKGPEPKIVTNN